MMTASELLTRLWRKASPLHRWQLVWLSNAKFVCGVCGIVRTDDGRVLLLRHRLWPPHHQWGFPSGYAKAGERHEETIAREVREETGLEVTVGRLLKVRSGFRYRVEFYYEATLVSDLGQLTLEASEILEARLFTLDDLPREMPHVHQELALGMARDLAPEAIIPNTFPVAKDLPRSHVVKSSEPENSPGNPVACEARRCAEA